MQRTERTSVASQQSRSALPRLSRPDFLLRGISYSAVLEGRAILFPFFLYYAYPIILRC